MRLITMYAVACIMACLFIFNNEVAYAQDDKNEIKANELIAEAQASSSGSERRELYDKALKLLEKAGYGLEANAIIADAMVEVKDYTNAARYYGYAKDDFKKEGLMKIGAAYIIDAEEDPKKASTYYNKAISYYRKAKEEELGNKMVGDSHFEQGIDHYDWALTNYVRANAIEDIGKVAEAYYAAGEKYYGTAAEAYSRAGNTEYFIKSGDLYFEIGDYEAAYAQYDTANHMDGIIKFADQMASMGDFTSANLQYRKVANYYEAQQNTDKLLSLAKKVYERGSYEQAAIFYEKAGKQKEAQKAELYHAIKMLDLSQAEDIAEKSGNTEMAGVIKKNWNYLEDLKEVAERFDQIKGDEPFVQMQLNEATQKREPNADDMKVFENHYNSFKGDILGELNTLSSTYNRLSDSSLQLIMRQRFVEYGAVRNVMDTNTFKRKLSDGQVQAQHLYM